MCVCQLRARISKVLPAKLLCVGVRVRVCVDLPDSNSEPRDLEN